MSRAAHKAFVAWLTAGSDGWDYECISGPFYRRDPNERAEQAINAGAERWRFQTRLTAKVLARHRAKEITIRSAPLKKGIIRLRLDADAHHGQPDARQAIEWIATRYFPSLYHEASERGHAGYVDIELPRLTWHGPDSPNGDGTYYESARKINARIDQLQVAMVKLLAAAGFQATFEINGRYEIRGKNDDGTRKIITRGRTAKHPRCAKDDDVPRLIASRSSWVAVERVIIDAGSVTPHVVAQPVQSIALPSHTKRTKGGRLRLANADNKNLNRWNCCREVALPYLGVVADWSDLTSDVQEHLVDGANKLYEDSGFATGERDRERDSAFCQKFRRLFATYDRTIRGTFNGGGVWFDEVADVQAADELIRSQVSKRELASLRSAGTRGTLTYWTLAHTLVVVTKNANTASGARNITDVPVASIIGMLGHFGIYVNGKFVRIALELFEQLGLMSVNRSYWAGHFSRRIKITGAARELPFVRHVYEAELKAESYVLAREQAARYTNRRSRLRPSINQPVISFTQCMMGEPQHLSSVSDANDDGYWSSLNELNAEYAERGRLSA